MPRISETELQEIRDWRARIELASRERDDFIKRCDRNVRFYIGDQWEDFDKQDSEREPRDKITVNKIFSHIAADVPTLQYTRPKFNVTAKKPIPVIDELGAPQTDENGRMLDQSFEIAQSQTHLVNYIFNEIDADKDLRLMVLAAKLALGVVKVGFTGDVEQVEIDGDQITFLARDQFFVDWVHWRNMLFDTEGGNLFKNHRWVIEEWIRPLRDVQADKLLINRSLIEATDRVGALPGDDRNSPLPNGTAADSRIREMQALSDDQKRVRGYNIYDFENNRFRILLQQAPHLDRSNEFFVNKNPQMPLGMERGPYVFLKFHEVPGKWYPVTDVEQLISLQREWNETRSAILTHKRRAARKILVPQGAFPSESVDDEIDSLQSDEDMAVVNIVEGAVIRALEQPQMDPAFAQSVPLMEFDFNDIGGQSGNARGRADTRSATEASIIEGRSQLRENDRRDNAVQPAAALIGRKLLQTLQVNMPDELMVAIGDPNLPEPFNFIPVTRESIQGEFNMNVAIGSTAPQTTSFQREQWKGLIVTLSQNPIILASRLLVRRSLAMFEIFDPELEKELVRIGEQAMQAQGSGKDMQGAPGIATQLAAAIGDRRAA